jgi:DNA-binding PadR family transcriptional regulator
VTADPSMTADDEQRADLSDAFGRPATASLRGLLPPRPRRGNDQEPAVPLQAARDASNASRGAVVTLAPRSTTPASTPVGEPAPEDTPAQTAPVAPASEDAALEETAPGDAVPDAVAPVGDTPARPAVRRPRSTSRTSAGTANRRWGSVRMASQEHVELLVLVALRRGPAGGRELAERLRTDSGGGLAPPPTTIQKTLHHLVRHGLVELGTGTERRRYRLTELGTRIGRARVRAWRSYRRAVDAVLDASDER